MTDLALDQKVSDVLLEALRVAIVRKEALHNERDLLRRKMREGALQKIHSVLPHKLLQEKENGHHNKRMMRHGMRHRARL